MKKRRWLRILRLQFGLRSLLIAMLVIAVWCAWYLQPQKRERILAGGAMLLVEQFRLVKAEDGEEREVQHGRWELRDHQRRLHVRGQYRDDQPSGRWNYYHPGGGKSASGLARYGAPDGLWKTWYASGRLRSESTFAQATLTGLEDRAPRGYHAYEMSSGSDVVDVISFPHGSVRTWHANGKPACVGEYQDGERSGVWTYFDEQGRKTAEGGYRRDRRDGRWTFWDQPGGPPRVIEYASGQIIEDVDAVLATCELNLMEGDVGRKLHAVRQLEQFGPRGVPILMRGARHEDARVRLLALRSLGQLGEDAASAIATLESLAINGHADVRDHALLALVQIDRPRRTQWLRTLLARTLPRRPDDVARADIIERVGRVGQAIVPALHELLDHEEVEIRLTVLDVVDVSGSTLAFPGISKLLDKARQDPSEAVRQRANEIVRPKGGGFF